MLTFKQLEAVFWVARLGGFSQAAARLHTTQSAISKRVQELESLFHTPLFDRSARAAKLTDKGEEMFVLAGQLLAQRDSAVEQFVGPQVIERRIRIGVTELTAMTWLPRLVNMIQATYPKVIIEPDVDTSVSLKEKLLSDEVDLMVVPNYFDDRRFSSRAVGSVENAWMAKPGLLDTRKVVRLHRLATHRMLTQSEKSGTGLIYAQWLKTLGVSPANTIVSNNLVAIIGMTVSGLGVSHLPRQCLAAMIDNGQLEVVRTTPRLPDVNYVAAYKGEQRSSLVASVAVLAQQACDFTRLYQTER